VPFQTGQIVTLSISHFIHDVYSSFLAPLLPLLIEKLSMSLTQAGFLSTIMQVPALLNPYIGSLADRISVRYFIILAPAMTADSHEPHWPRAQLWCVADTAVHCRHQCCRVPRALAGNGVQAFRAEGRQGHELFHGGR
jgi:MFS family permease